jgi:hypothetical protein
VDTKNLKGRIHNAMYQCLCEKGWVAPVDVLLGVGALTKENLDCWRFGKTPFLEQACHASLKQLSEIMREIRGYAAKNELKPSWTCYHQWGKHKDRRLRFSKSGDENIEHQYATHYVDPVRVAEIKKRADDHDTDGCSS